MPYGTIITKCNLSFDNYIFSSIYRCHENILIQIAIINVMKKINEGNTVGFVTEEVTLYGEVEKIEVIEDRVYYTIYANHKLYRHVEESRIIHNYGVLYE